MFGYFEAPYTVERQVTLNVTSGTQHFEMRQPCWRTGQPVPLAYIALEGKNLEGALVHDYLYLYDNREKLERDWALIASDAPFKRDDLDYCELIHDHATGFTKAGGITWF